ncbi:MAG TPA: glycosyltransferase family 4 protein [Bryobacteraceae bacterium]|nr:glycosyltransferase family 4 protein [Bryobacteraceae bacterium]
MRIAFVVHDYHRAGGHSRYVAELATRFAKQHEVHVFANRIEPETDSQIHFHQVPAWRANAFTTVLSFILPVTFQIGRGFDIIHSQGFCGFRGNVFTAHICNRAWHVALQRLEGGATFRESVFNAMGTTLEHGLYRFGRNRGVIAISQRVADDLIRIYHCPAPIQVIHHGVDLDLFSPANRTRWRSEIRREYGIAEDEMVFLYVGDLRKGATRSIQALAQLQRGRLLFVSRSRTTQYESQVRDSGLAGRVLFAGATNQVERFYAAADALLHPTPYDAFGMVVSEAMASGLPVIVSREAGAAELIEHGANGLVIQDLSAASELAAAMDKLMRDPSWAAQLGGAARKTVESMSWDVVASQTMRVYEQVARNSK